MLTFCAKVKETETCPDDNKSNEDDSECCTSAHDYDTVRSLLQYILYSIHEKGIILGIRIAIILCGHLSQGYDHSCRR